MSRIDCALHGEQKGFCVCTHVAERILRFSPGSTQVVAPGQVPGVYCTVCRSAFVARGDWTESELSLVAGSIACIECLRSEQAQLIRSRSGVWTARYEVKPLPGNESMGAVVDCFVHASDPKLAEYVMKMFMKNGLWEIISVVEAIRAITETEMSTPERISDFETAEKDGECFRWYPVGLKSTGLSN